MKPRDFTRLGHGASKTIATPQQGPETLPDSPLLDLSNACVKTFIRNAKKRGYVTHDQVNALLSSEEVKSEQIEDILAMFSEMGINVIETEGRGRALRACSRINRSIRCSPHDTPSASMSCHTRLAP